MAVPEQTLKGGQPTAAGPPRQGAAVSRPGRWVVPPFLRVLPLACFCSAPSDRAPSCIQGCPPGKVVARP